MGGVTRSPPKDGPVHPSMPPPDPPPDKHHQNPQGLDQTSTPPANSSHPQDQPGPSGQHSQSTSSLIPPFPPVTFQPNINRYFSASNPAITDGISKYKRKMTSPTGPIGNSAKKNNTDQLIQLQNRYAPLANMDNPSNNSNTATPQQPKPAVLFIRNVPMSTVVALITTAIKNDNFKCTNLRRGAIVDVKLQLNTIDEFRAAVNALDSSSMNYYTYRMKTLRGLSVIIKGIEVTDDAKEMCEDIQFALEKKGFKVRQVINILNRNKVPQPLYKVELEPCETKLKPGEVHPIYSLRLLINRCISVEEPHKRFGPVQCTNCQEFDHTKGYCKLPPKCVVCGEGHSTEFCTKPKDDPTCRKCANCDQGHTANYRGCCVYVGLKKASAPTRRKPTQPSKPAPAAFAPKTTAVPAVLHTSYRNALEGPPPPPPHQTDPTTGASQTTEQLLQTMMSTMMQFMITFQSSMQEMMRNQNQLIELLQCRR